VPKKIRFNKLFLSLKETNFIGEKTLEGAFLEYSREHKICGKIKKYLLYKIVELKFFGFKF
jgi:hypothetical protein